MNKIVGTKWEDRFKVSLSEENVRSLFKPPERWRVSKYTYNAGEETGGSMTSGKCVLLTGKCQLFFNGYAAAVLVAGDFAELPGGEYTIAVEGDERLEIIFIWELPAGLFRLADNAE